MRKLLFIISVLSALNCFAAGYTDKFFEDGKYWIVERYYPYANLEYNEGSEGSEYDNGFEFDNETKYYHMIVDGDTIVNGIEAKKIRMEWCATGQTEEIRVGYEKDGVVYIQGGHYPKYGRFVPVLDFSAEIGDEILVRDGDYAAYWDEDNLTEDERNEYFFDPYFVKDVKYLSINNIERKVIYFQDHSQEKIWIEGIGLTNNIDDDILLAFPLPSCQCPDYAVDRIFGCYKDNECLFEASRLNEYLNPEPGLAAVDEIGVDTGSDEEPIYDLMGRKVTNPQPGSIYVTPSGKKIYR